MNIISCFRGDNAIEQAVSRLRYYGAARYLSEQSSPTRAHVSSQGNMKWGSTTMRGEVPAVEAIHRKHKRNDFGSKTRNIMILQANVEK